MKYLRKQYNSDLIFLLIEFYLSAKDYIPMLEKEVSKDYVTYKEFEEAYHCEHSEAIQENNIFGLSQTLSLLRSDSCRSCCKTRQISGLPRSLAFARNDKKCAFSLAEAMVLLLIMSIVLAVTAPLIAGKSNTDNEKLIRKGKENSVETAMGKFQKLVIGSAQKIVVNNKLIINKTPTFNGDILIGKDKNNGVTISAEGLTYKDGGRTILKIKSDGETNILMQPGTTYKLSCNGVCVAPSHGHVYIDNVLAAGDFIINSQETMSASLQSVPEAPVNLTATVDHDRITRYPAFIPVSKGTRFKCSDTPCYFVPLTPGNTMRTEVVNTFTNFGLSFNLNQSSGTTFILDPDYVYQEPTPQPTVAGGGGDDNPDSDWCLARGTMIALADGSQKAIQDIDFDDELKVWDFDNGCLSSAKPLWIKVAEVTKKYNLLTFSDGRTLKTINQHRIFNKEAGKYTYPMTDDTPLGTTTLLDDGSEVTLVKKEVIEEPVEFYNIMTEYHFNCFANGISTSNRFNNLYPIKDYKFVKDNREPVPYDEYKEIPYEWYEKMRLAEQPRDVNRDGADSHANSITEHILNVYIAKNKRKPAIV